MMIHLKAMFQKTMYQKKVDICGNNIESTITKMIDINT